MANEESPRSPELSAIIQRVAEVSLRLMARLPSPATLKRVRTAVEASPTSYPWQQVVDAVLAEPADPSALLQRGLEGQRDFLMRSAPPRQAARVVRAARTGAKTLLAIVLSRMIFFALYTLAAMVLLVLIKHRWPDLDIYRLLPWVERMLPLTR
jgi:hypothetical protein